MVLGYHVVLGMYGFWLPNDPRGSWSDFVWSEELSKFGESTKVSTRHSRARDPHDHARRLAAKSALKFPPVRLNHDQSAVLAEGISVGAKNHCRPVWACAIMPDHVHLVFSRIERTVEETVAEIKKRATWELTRTGVNPMLRHRVGTERIHSPWARGFWKVFLNAPDDVERSIQYVNRNPVKDGLPAQCWSFVEKPDI